MILCLSMRTDTMRIAEDGDDSDEDDDDLYVGGVVQDLKCPLTLTWLEKPVTSCVISFFPLVSNTNSVLFLQGGLWAFIFSRIDLWDVGKQQAYEEDVSSFRMQADDMPERPEAE